MKKSEILEICSEVYDKLTTVRGFVELQQEFNHNLYSSPILHELDGINEQISRLVVKAHESSDKD